MFTLNKPSKVVVGKYISLFMLCISSALMIKANSYKPSDLLFHDSIQVKMSQSSKIHKIRLFPNVTKDVLFFTAEGEEGKVYQIFVFDIDGKLSKQTQVRNRETTLLARFDKGYYLFDVFSNDERIENGSISIK